MIILALVLLGRWIWPECVESFYCRRRGCPDCAWLAPCDAVLRRGVTALPKARLLTNGLDKQLVMQDNGNIRG
jgi:hypothetical protein